MYLSLEERFEIEKAMQESARQNYEWFEQHLPELIELGWVEKPPLQRTDEQIMIQLRTEYMSRTHFDMRKVVTGSRRKWKRR